MTPVEYVVVGGFPDQSLALRRDQSLHLQFRLVCCIHRYHSGYTASERLNTSHVRIAGHAVEEDIFKNAIS